MSKRAILVTGATGKQGGSVLRALLRHPSFSASTHTIFAATRDPSSASAQRLAAQSPDAVRVVRGDLADAAALFRALPEAPWGVYALTTMGGDETASGKALVDEAVRAGSTRFVLSSVDRGAGAPRTDVPHFATKHDVEAHLKQAAAAASSGASSSPPPLTYTILRPAFFLDNFEWGFFGKVVGSLWRDHVGADKPLAVVDTADIGEFAASAFLEEEKDNIAYRNQAIELAGDRLTFARADQIFREQTGRPLPTTYGFLGSLLLWFNKDMRMMVRFWNEAGFGADPAECNKLHRMTDMAAWAGRSSFAKKSA